MTTIITKFPTVTVDGQIIAICVGPAIAEFGDTVDLYDMFNRRRYNKYCVLSADTLPADEVAEEVLELWDLSTLEQFVTALSQQEGTGLPLDTEVTVYTVRMEDLGTLKDEKEDTYRWVDDPVLFQMSVGGLL